MQVNKKWLSDEIGNDYLEWNDENVLITAGTGTGKTYFVLNVYCPWLIEQGKKVLYLCNRKALRKEIQDIVQSKQMASHVTVLTYQHMQEILLNGNTIPKFDVYVCDEAHYFTDDSTFNLYTDVSYEYIINQRNAVILWITATGYSFFDVIKEDIKSFCMEFNEPYRPLKEYSLPCNYKHVSQIYWFRKRELFSIIDKIATESDSKAIYFCNSIESMKRIYEHYKIQINENELSINDFSFYCSENQMEKNDWAREHCSLSAVQYITDKGYTFASKILVTTKSLDNGVDFKDYNIKHVICDIFDLDSAIQCLGRKRPLDNNDICTFYIRDYKHNEINLFKKINANEFDSIDLFNSNYDDWVDEYGMQRGQAYKSIYYNHTIEEWKINKLRHAKLIFDYNYLCLFNKKNSYKDIIDEFFPARLINESMEFSRLHKIKNMTNLRRFIMKYQGEYLSEELKSELISLCSLTDKYNRSLSRIGYISEYLMENYKYIVVSKTHKVDGKSVRNWVIERYTESETQK